jgi:putative toxin-antitoxin system antitoxin component (TIGR02293 family)
MPTKSTEYQLTASHSKPFLVEDFEIAYGNQINKLERIRKGVSYHVLELMSRGSSMPVKQLLALLGMPQTTYNKRKRENGNLSIRDTELLLMLYETLRYGQEVFNQEQGHFQRWLHLPNAALGGYTPLSLFDTITGIQEVKRCLQRLDFGTLA